MTKYTHTLSLSLGGDVPTWEGEATVSYTVTPGGAPTGPSYDSGGDPGWPPEIDDIRVLKIDGREPDPEEAELMVDFIGTTTGPLWMLLEHAAECDAERHAADLDARDEAKAERVSDGR